MCIDPAIYFDYFAGLLRRSPRIRAAADVTPSYALLSRDRFTSIRDEFAERGVRTVPVFLMRDPVERAWSQIRMQVDRAPEQFSQPSEEVLDLRHMEDTYSLRSRYQDTIATLDSVFLETDLHYGFYETLFTVDSARSITDLLGMQHIEPDIEKRRNSSTRPTAALPEHIARRVAQHHADVYETVAARFPRIDLLALWPHSKHVLG